MIDVLFDARNLLVVGNFKQAILECNTARSASKSPEDVAELQAEKLLLTIQAHIGLQQEELALQAVTSSNVAASHPSYKAAMAWSRFMMAGKKSPIGFHLDNHEVKEAYTALSEGLENSNTAQAQQALFYASAMVTLKDFAGALTVAAQWSVLLDNMSNNKVRRLRTEFAYLSTEALLLMNRIDLAQKEVAKMEAMDDESVFTYLMKGVVSLHEGQQSGSHEAYETALAFFSGALARYGQTSMVMNLCAIANIGLGKVDDAEKELRDANEIASNDCHEQVSAANMLVVQALKGEFDAEGDFRAEGSSSSSMQSHKDMEEQLNNAIAGFFSA